MCTIAPHDQDGHGRAGEDGHSSRRYPDRRRAHARPTAAPAERVAQTACDHPYLRLRTGATWIYSSPNGAVTWDVAAVTGDPIPATAGILLAGGAAATSIQWHCASDGLVSDAAADYLAADTQHNTGVSLTGTTVVSLLPADQLSVGLTWDMVFTVTYIVLNGAQKLPYRNQYWNHFTLAATQPLPVGDQTCDALRVEDVTTSTVTGAGFLERTFHTATKWSYVRDIGLVSYRTMSTVLSPRPS
jgi:hypothetical protein